MNTIRLIALIGVIFTCSAKLACAEENSFSNLEITQTYSVRYSNDLPVRTVGTIKSVLQVLFANAPDGELAKLKSFVAENRTQLNNNRYASYDEASCRVFINTNSLQSEIEEWETIAHEIGHSVIFSKLTPMELSRLAHDVGGWQQPDSPNTFYDRSFFVRFVGADIHASSFPTFYAYTNIHEWLAENFANYILGKANKKKPVNLELYRFFDRMFK